MSDAVEIKNKVDSAIKAFKKWTLIEKIDIKKSYDTKPCVVEFYTKQHVDILLKDLENAIKGD